MFVEIFYIYSIPLNSGSMSIILTASRVGAEETGSKLLLRRFVRPITKRQLSVKPRLHRSPVSGRGPTLSDPRSRKTHRKRRTDFVFLPIRSGKVQSLHGVIFNGPFITYIAQAIKCAVENFKRVHDLITPPVCVADLSANLSESSLARWAVVSGFSSLSHRPLGP